MPWLKGRAAIAIRKYGILLPPAEEEKEERQCSGQPSTQQALISHLDVIYCGLHRENSVYCNRDHNYHRSALSVSCACTLADGDSGLCSGCVCLQGDICACINELTQRKWRLSKSTFIWTLTSPLSIHLVFFSFWLGYQAALLYKEGEGCSHNHNNYK